MAVPIPPSVSFFNHNYFKFLLFWLLDVVHCYLVDVYCDLVGFKRETGQDLCDSVHSLCAIQYCVKQLEINGGFRGVPWVPWNPLFVEKNLKSIAMRIYHA